MADDANDLFIFGDDFEVILEILESDEGLEKQSVSAVNASGKNILRTHRCSLYLLNFTAKCCTRQLSVKSLINDEFSL